MRRSSPGAIRFALFFCAAVVVAGTAGCSKPVPTGPITDVFKATVQSADFRWGGTVSGTMQGFRAAQTGASPAGSEAPIAQIDVSGTYRFSHGDDTSISTLTASGVSTVVERVSVGDWTYDRTDYGPWKKSARAAKTRSFTGPGPADSVDMGLADYDGRQLHRLEARDSAAVLSSFDVDLSDPATTGSATLTYWVDDYGTPAAFEVTASWSQGVGPNKLGVSGHLTYTSDPEVDATVEAPAMPVEPAVSAFSSSEALHEALSKKPHFKGEASGTLTLGSTTSRVEGQVRLTAAGDTSVAISARSFTAQERVVKGVRYTSRDGSIWVNRGKMAAEGTLAGILASFPTDRDAGIKTFAQRQLHRIEAPADSIDVGTALGLDLPDSTNKSTRFHVWADGDGTPWGFGATIQWSRKVDGQPQSCELEVEVEFVTEETGLSIGVPIGAWKWVTGSPAGVGYGVPAGWKKSTSKGTTLYTDSKTGAFTATTFLSEGKTAAQYLDEHAGELDLVIDTEWNTTVEEQAARAFMGHTKSSGTFVIGTIVGRGVVDYMFVFAGPIGSKKVAAQKLSDQITLTIHFQD